MDWIAEHSLHFIGYGLGILLIIWTFVSIFGTAFGKWKRDL